MAKGIFYLDNQIVYDNDNGKRVVVSDNARICCKRGFENRGTLSDGRPVEKRGVSWFLLRSGKHE